VRDDGDEIAGMANLKDTNVGLTTAAVSAEGQWVKLRVDSKSVWLTPDHARFFARKLNNMARLAEQRRAETSK
jgi:hypothetical protein